MVQTLLFVWSRLPWIIAFAIKNVGIVAGIVKQIIKILVQIVLLTPTREDDIVMDAVEKKFSEWQDWFYAIASRISDWYSKFKDITKGVKPNA